MFCTIILISEAKTQNTVSDSETFKNISENLTSEQYADLADSCSKDSLDLSIRYGRMGLEAARKEKNELTETRLLDILGVNFYFAGNKQEALTYMQLAKIKFKKLNDSDKLSSTLNRIGAIYHEWGLYDVAMKYFLDALKIAESANPKEESRIAQSYNNLGLLYKDMNETDKAYDYFQRALNYYKKSDDKRMISYTLNNIGIIYKRVGEYEKAIEYYNESLKIKKQLNDKRGIPNSLGNIGDVYLLKNDLDLATKYYTDALFLMIENNDGYGIANTQNNLATIYTKKNMPEKAINILNEALPIAQRNKLKDLQKDIYKSYSNAYEKKNDLKNALYYFKIYNSIKDSILNGENSNKILELEVAYNTEKKEQENELLRIKSNQSENQLENEISLRSILILVIIVFVFIVLIFIIRNRISRKSKLIFEEKNKQIELINQKLVNINKELDQRVNERTQALSYEMSEKQKMLDDLQKAFKKAEEANLLKNAFLSNINHEIRTPLSAIIGLAEVLKNKFPKDQNPQLLTYVDGIQQSSGRLLCLLNNILDISRIEANDFKINLAFADINKLVLNATDLHKFKINEKGLTLNMNLGKSTQAVTDSDILIKVISDIIDNSVKYTNTGKIEISSGFNYNSSEVYVKIADTGIGIDENYLPHIFDTFRQESMGYDRMYQGAGLGLPLAKRLLKLMNSRIEISSKKDKGTDITIFIPSSKDNLGTELGISYESVVIPDNSFSKETNILLVEDDEFNALFLQTILESVGKISLATGGNEALEIIEEMNEKKKTFDIVILDINLPEQWEGISLMKEIKKRYSNYAQIPYIAQSAYSLKSDREKILGHGFNEFLTKPVDSENLLNIVKKYIIKKS